MAPGCLAGSVVTAAAHGSEEEKMTKKGRSQRGEKVQGRKGGGGGEGEGKQRAGKEQQRETETTAQMSPQGGFFPLTEIVPSGRDGPHCPRLCALLSPVGVWASSVVSEPQSD